MLESQNSPLVSVVMIFLNAEKFIREAIESVLMQTYSHWELIFVDDGSSDAGTEIALRYVRQYPDKMRYFEHPGHQNKGMSASRNLGIQRSQGEYVALLDADDVYLPQKLEQHVALLSEHAAASMVYDTTQYWYSWTGRPEDARLDRLRSLGAQTDQLYHPPEMFVRFLRNTANTPATCSVLMRRAAIDRVGGFEESFSGMLEDQAFFHKFCLYEPVYVEGGFTSRYRQHPDSHCYVSRKSGYWDPESGLSPARAAFLHWLEAYLVQQNITDKQIWRPLRKELWSYRHATFHAVWSSIEKTKTRLGRKVRSLF